MEQEYKYSMWCIAPSCENTTKKTPNKLFFRVPIEEKRRRLWINAVRRHYSEFSKTSSLFVCEDHFNVEEDMENYVKWKLMGGQKKLKSHVVPHIFACQRDGKRAAPRSPRQASTKRSQKQYIQDILSAASSSSNNGPSFELDESNANNAQYVQLLNSSEREPSTSTASPKRFTTCYTQTESPPQKPYYRSKEVQCCPSRTSVAYTAKPICVDAATSPSAPGVVRVPSKRLIFADSADSDSDSSEGKTWKMYDSDTSTDFCLESDCLSAETDGEESTKLLQRLKKQALETTMQLVPLKCRFYLGIGKDAYFIINLLQKYTPAPIANIFITLKKIRTNATFGSLADDFGMSESSVSRAFSKTITHLSGNLSKFIKWYSKRQLKQLLPIAFTAYYSNTVSIIDCLEIEIEKPNNPIHQSLTWSEYKKANTLKYLISCTPNGIINFISIGFGGRASDTIIVEESGFLEKLPPGAAVMADRGFKHIEHLLIERKCSLIRPPTVEKDKKSSKADVLATKRIASLRIHVERVIRRLREFKILKPHSCINSSIIRYTDHMTVIACGLVNMQSALIK